MTAERQERLFNTLLADVQQSLKARVSITRYLSRAEIALLERNGYSVGYYNPRGADYVQCRIEAAA